MDILNNGFRLALAALLYNLCVGDVSSAVPQYGESRPTETGDPPPYDSDTEYDDESMLLESMDDEDITSLEADMPNDISAIDELTALYTKKANPGGPPSGVIEPKLLTNAAQAMVYVTSLYKRLERFGHMYAGKSDELMVVQERYISVLSGMLEDKAGLKHLSFVRRYLSHVSKGNALMVSSDARRTELMSEVVSIYNDARDKYARIKLDFERHYSTPKTVVSTTLTSFIAIGEAYKRLFQLHGELIQAIKALRQALNKVRATSVYMFSYTLCLDILFTVILPMRTMAIQDVIGTKSTGDVLSGYHNNIKNRVAAIKSILKVAQIPDDERFAISSIYTDVKGIELKARKMHKSTADIVKHSNKEAVQLVDKKIAVVIDVWNKRYRQPIVMSKKLIDEYMKLSKLVRKIEMGEGEVHRNKQALYTMSIHCDELYQRARKLANLPAFYEAGEQRTSEEPNSVSDTNYKKDNGLRMERPLSEGGSGDYTASQTVTKRVETSRRSDSASSGDGPMERERDTRSVPSGKRSEWPSEPTPLPGNANTSSQSTSEYNKNSQETKVLRDGNDEQYPSLYPKVVPIRSENHDQGSNDVHYIEIEKDGYETPGKYFFTRNGEGQYKFPIPVDPSSERSDNPIASDSHANSSPRDYSETTETADTVVTETDTRKKARKRQLNTAEEDGEQLSVNGTKRGRMTSEDNSSADSLESLMYHVERISTELAEHKEELTKTKSQAAPTTDGDISMRIIQTIKEICKTYHSLTYEAPPKEEEKPTPNPEEAA